LNIFRKYKKQFECLWAETTLGRPAQRAARARGYDAARLGDGAARWADGGTGDGRGTGGSPARGWRRGATATGERRGGPGDAASDCGGQDDGVRRGAVGVGARAGCRDARRVIPTAALRRARDARRMAATRQRGTATRARRGTRRLTGGAPSAISELKIIPKENSSKQIDRKWEKFQKNLWR
jgi:hypothetical protein